MDDITPTMNWDKFNQLRKVFEKHQIYPLLGVVPNNLDEKLNIGEANVHFWEVMCELKRQGWSIAQHGYTHIYHTDEGGLLNINKRSEFSGRSYKEQLSDIIAGKKILRERNLDTDIWMAPAHSYDNNTLCALASAGFRYVTDGYSLWPYKNKALTFIPCQTSKPKHLQIGFYTVCLHANNMNDKQINDIDVFLKKYANVCVTYNESLRWPVGNFFFTKIIERTILMARQFKRMISK